MLRPYGPGFQKMHQFKILMKDKVRLAFLAGVGLIEESDIIQSSMQF